MLKPEDGERSVRIPQGSISRGAWVTCDPALLAELLLPGVRAEIDFAAFDTVRGRVLLRLSGPDVPDSAEAKIVMTQTVDPSHPSVTLSAALHAV